jgi:hypothetical protein
MSNFTPITKDLISIGSVETGQMADIADNLTSLSVSLTMDQAAELSFSVIDPDFAFARNNYFQIRRDVFYRELVFEIARIEVSRSASIDPEYKVVCYNKNVQMMKRDKKPEAYRGISASDYALTVSKRFNMKAFVEPTQKKQSIVKGRSKSADENVWDVLQRSAKEAEFVCFEIDNCLFFCSQRYLLGKWGDSNYQFMGNYFVPFGWPENNDVAFPGSKNKYVLLDMPTFTRAENDPMDAEGTLIVERTNGVQLRPGMTVNVTGIPDFENGYLVTEVSFDEGVSDPVRVSFRTPVKPSAGQKGKQGVSNTGNTGGAPTAQSEDLSKLTALLDASIISDIQDHVNRNFVGEQSETERNALIRQQINAAVAAAARVYSLTSRRKRSDALNEQLNLLNSSTNRGAYLALGSVRTKLLDGPPPPRVDSEFPTELIIDSQYNLAVGLAMSQGSLGSPSPAAQPPVPSTPTPSPPSVASTNQQPRRSVTFPVAPPLVAGSLPRALEQKIISLIEQKVSNLSERQRITTFVLSSAKGIYNLTSTETKNIVFNAFLRANQREVVATDVMRAIRLELILNPTNAIFASFNVLEGLSGVPNR